MSYKSFSFGLLGIAAGAFLTGALQFVIAWNAPKSSAPQDNVLAPINVGATTQVKTGPLMTNVPANTALFTGAGLQVGGVAYVGGLTSVDQIKVGNTALGCTATNAGAIRWNSTAAPAQMEYCDGGGTWKSFGSGGGSLAYGGSYAKYGTGACGTPNIQTGACTCPDGYSSRMLNEGWDAWRNAYVCEKSGVSGTGDNLGNHIATQNINMSGAQVTNLGNTVNPSDAATKAYVDGKLGGGGGGSPMLSGWPDIIKCDDGDIDRYFILSKDISSTNEVNYAHQSKYDYSISFIKSTGAFSRSDGVGLICNKDISFYKNKLEGKDSFYISGGSSSSIITKSKLGGLFHGKTATGQLTNVDTSGNYSYTPATFTVDADGYLLRNGISVCPSGNKITTSGNCVQLNTIGMCGNHMHINRISYTISVTGVTVFNEGCRGLNVDQIYWD